MQIRQFFPRGIAKGQQFFDRVDELKRLKHNILSGTHTLLLAPRRYGKSSLAKRGIETSELAWAEVDLFLAIDDEDIACKIIRGVENVIKQISNRPEQWFDALRNYFLTAHKKWTVGIKGVHLELIPDSSTSVAENVLDALSALEFVLKNKGVRAVLFIDEVQEISGAKTGKAIEGAIRHFAQDCEQVSFIFSGSRRRMLEKMFKERSRPLYALCDEILLRRIEASYYEQYLNHVAMETFDEPMQKRVIDAILILSERHPKYVYTFCFEIWLRCGGHAPTLQQVTTIWHDYLKHQQKDVREHLRTLSQTQIKLLEAIAKGNNSKLSSHENQQKLKLTSSAIVQALQVLEDKDYIEKLTTDGYRIIDPIVKGSFLLQM